MLMGAGIDVPKGTIVVDPKSWGGLIRDTCHFSSAYMAFRLVYEFPVAAVTNYHNLVAEKNTHVRPRSGVRV